jgi:hypothetical protein
MLLTLRTTLTWALQLLVQMGDAQSCLACDSERGGEDDERTQRRPLNTSGKARRCFAFAIFDRRLMPLGELNVDMYRAASLARGWLTAGRVSAAVRSAMRLRRSVAWCLAFSAPDSLFRGSVRVRMRGAGVEKSLVTRSFDRARKRGWE